MEKENLDNGIKPDVNESLALAGLLTPAQELEKEKLIRERQKAFERIENDYYDFNCNHYKNNITYRERVVAINKRYDELLQAVGCTAKDNVR